MEIPGEAAPAIDRSILLPCIIRYFLPEGSATSLTLDSQFMNARFRAQQMVRVMECASTELHITLTKRVVAQAFDVNHCSVSARAAAKSSRSSEPRTALPTLTRKKASASKLDWRKGTRKQSDQKGRTVPLLRRSTLRFRDENFYLGQYQAMFMAHAQNSFSVLMRLT
jgi:hypothetical protein